MSYINAHTTGDIVTIWERINGERVSKQHAAPWYLYAEDSQGEHTTLFGNTVSRHDFKSRDDMYAAMFKFRVNNQSVFESDIKPEYKLISEIFDSSDVPDLNVTYLDIEVDYDMEIGFSSVENPYAPINAIALKHSWKTKPIVLAVPPPNWKKDEWDELLDSDLHRLADIRLFNNERELLLELLTEIRDSDGLAGWNSSMFDIPYIGKRLLALGKAYFRRLSFDEANPPRWNTVEVFGKEQQTLELYGRLNIDYMQLFKKFEMANRMSYKLEAISNEVLPELPKLSYDGTLATLYKDDFNHFLRYNIRDTECLVGFEEKLGYIALANTMYHDSGGLFKDVLGTIRLAELSLVNYCHEVLNVIAPDVPEVKDDGGGKADGAYVLKPKAGMHEWIGSIDINSLYPSAIRSINISPETLIGQFASTVDSFDAIAANEDRNISLIMNDTGEAIVHKATDWSKIFKQNNWSVSGYGTVFTQDKQGIIPSILEMWYATRNKFKGTMESAKDQRKALLANYESNPIPESDHIRSGFNMTETDAVEYDRLSQEISFYDRMQYCYKIKLNSLYGALLNKYFRFYDPRMGQSTTGTGRAILKYMCSKTNELLCGEFDDKGESVVYGDTDSVYFKTFADNKEDAIFIADGIADLVNQSFPKFMRETFLCTEGFDTIIKAGRECVASRGIFVTPKRYALKLKNLDGYDCDKMKVMGLDIKKTILPQFIQDALSDFIERYLDGDEWDDVAKDIVAFKEHLMTDVPIQDLGLPKGCNKVEFYKQQLDTLQDAARLPGHVRAAIMYNSYLEKYGDKESFGIVSSMKVKVFYLKKPEGKFKSIALPVDLPVVPKWFLDNVEVDREQQVFKLVDKPLDNILKAIGKVPPSKQTLFVDSLLEF